MRPALRRDGVRHPRAAGQKRPLHHPVGRPQRRAQTGRRGGPSGPEPQRARDLLPDVRHRGKQLGPALGEAVGEAMGEEAAAQEVSVLLGPGLNIKRSPLCGRNFEYFSEDPYLAGKMAAGYVRGIQKNGIAACPKHFAVNSQELRRMASDSIVDERTLREIYLTGFEIVVKEAKPKTIMSSYNLINGTYANENAHLLKDILRKDWGLRGRRRHRLGRLQRPRPRREERLHAGNALPRRRLRPGS